MGGPSEGSTGRLFLVANYGGSGSPWPVGILPKPPEASWSTESGLSLPRGAWSAAQKLGKGLQERKEGKHSEAARSTKAPAFTPEKNLCGRPSGQEKLRFQSCEWKHLEEKQGGASSHTCPLPPHRPGTHLARTCCVTAQGEARLSHTLDARHSLSPRDTGGLVGLRAPIR